MRRDHARITPCTVTVWDGDRREFKPPAELHRSWKRSGKVFADDMSSMRPSLRTGVSFGLTSGVITTLGLLVGLHAGTHSRAAVLGGIVTIAVADAMSDALGIHIAEEANHKGTAAHVWESTIATFLVKFTISATFVIPVLALPLQTAVIASIVWGFGLLGVLSWFVARAQGLSAWNVIGEHWLIGLAVIALTHWLGDWIGETLGG